MPRRAPAEASPTHHVLDCDGFDFTNAVVSCLGYMEASRGAAPQDWGSEPRAGQQRNKEYQQTVFMAVFGNLDPDLGAFRARPGAPRMLGPQLRPGLGDCVGPGLEAPALLAKQRKSNHSTPSAARPALSPRRRRPSAGRQSARRSSGWRSSGFGRRRARQDGVEGDV